MKPRRRYRFPDEQQALWRRAIWLEIISLPAMLSVIVVIGLTMGSSQAMRTAWVEDILSLVPPIAFLISAPVRGRKPTQRFPFGYHRAGHIAFLSASTALTMFGLLLLYESVRTLVMREHPTIGTSVLLGRQIWSGWLMVAALIYSAIVPVILGRLKVTIARQLHEKVIYTDAYMNKDDWLTALAALAGVLGIGMGWWWADAVAGGFISLAVTWDGLTNLKRVVFDLMDHRPSTLDGEPELDLEQRILSAVRELPWVRDVELRLREEGSMVTGEVLIVPRDERHPVERLDAAARAATDADWRCYDIDARLVSDHELRSHDPAGPSS